ncbi:MFS transporter [Butyrivibrio sp. NC3005]|uniref:MFS transporter n=1 Tax=Butyrivibrio sp. NC3005 TaxID=1280685 RepID=UPI00041E6D54|nr:MFS transporter [Butyrivibrio sp. NC3005]
MNAIKKANLFLILKALLQFQGFIGPVIFVFYTQYMGLTTSEYLICDSILFIIMAICEMPSGIVADYIGRKKALVISQTAIIVGMIVLIISASFWGAVIVACIYGIFGALESGVAESVLYETYELNKCKDEYEYLQAKTGGIGFVISILYAVASGYLVEYKVTLPVILDLAVCVITLIASVILLEDYKKYDNKTIDLPNKSEVKNVIFIIFIVTILSSCSRVMFSFYQPILLEANIPVFFLGYASAIYSLVSAGAAFLYKKIRKSLSISMMYTVIIGLQFISTLGIGIMRNYTVVVFILIQQVQRGLMGTFLYMQVNRYIDTNSGNRVSLMSVMYCGISILTGISLYISSALTNIGSMRFALSIYIVLINAALILSILVFKKNEKKIIRYDEV